MLTIVPPWQAQAQPLARWFALGTFAIVAVKLVDEPGANALSEPRQGLLIALGAAARAGGEHDVRSRRRRGASRAPKTYTPLPPPEYAPDSSYGPPQY